jgi:hypothetical protein
MNLDNPLPHRRQSQLAILKAEFERNPSRWIPAPHLQRITSSLAVHSRVSDLRKTGMVIENETRQVERDGEIVPVSAYRYRPDLTKAAADGQEDLQP